MVRFGLLIVWSVGLAGMAWGQSPSTAADVARVIVTGPVTVGAIPPVPPTYDPNLPPPSPIVYSPKWGLTLLALVGTDAEKTGLIVQVPIGVSADFQRKYLVANGWMDFARSPVFAITGRLTVEDEVGLFPNGTSPILTEIPVFELGEKRRLVLVAESVVEVTRANRDRFPPEGTVAVEGRPADAKTDLKLTPASTLAIRNGLVPLVVVNRPPQAAAQIRAAGNLVTTDGRTEIRDANVRILRR